MSIIRDVKISFRSGDTVVQLIIINVAVFLLFNLVVFGVLNLSGNIDVFEAIFNRLMLPSKLSDLLYQPFSFITYAFLHDGIWHIVGNMLMLFWLGRIFSDLAGNRRILPLYIYGGIAGGALYVIAYNLMPKLGLGSHLVGASASVMAVVMAGAVLSPDYKIRLIFIGDVSIKYIAAFFIVSDLFVVAASVQPGGSIAHLGGVLFGWIYTVSLRRGYDMSRGFNRTVDRLRNFFDNKPQPKVRVTYRRPTANTDFNSLSSSERQRRVDEILDKISKSGYDSLTKEEKEILFKASKD